MTGETLKHYVILGVPAGASFEKITARYKAILGELRSRIGSQQIDTQEIARLREAYSVLSDAEKRAFDNSDDGNDRACPSSPQTQELRLVDMDVGEAVS